MTSKDTKVANDVASEMTKLTIDPAKSNRSKTATYKSKKKIAESWEDDDSSSGEGGADLQSPIATQGLKEGTSAPPPTPVSPMHNSERPFSAMDHQVSPAAGTPSAVRRPEKTDAVARRMIAGALGLKTPKQTEEQKAYDKAVREKERKRKEEQRSVDRQKQEELERAKQAIWDD